MAFARPLIELTPSTLVIQFCITSGKKMKEIWLGWDSNPQSFNPQPISFIFGPRNFYENSRSKSENMKAKRIKNLVKGPILSGIKQRHETLV